MSGPEQHDDVLIDLGVASVETKGPDGTIVEEIDRLEFPTTLSE